MLKSYHIYIDALIMNPETTTLLLFKHLENYSNRNPLMEHLKNHPFLEDFELFWDSWNTYSLEEKNKIHNTIKASAQKAYEDGNYENIQGFLHHPYFIEYFNQFPDNLLKTIQTICVNHEEFEYNIHLKKPEFLQERIQAFENYLECLNEAHPNFIQKHQYGISENIINLAWDERYDSLQVLLNAGFKNKIKYKNDRAVFQYQLSSEMMKKFLDLGISYIDQNDTINYGSAGPVEQDLRFDEKRHWVNLIGEGDDSGEFLENIKILKAHSQFEKEDTRIWDLNTLNHQAFQERIFGNGHIEQTNEEVMNDKGNIKNFILSNILPAYENELDTIEITCSFKIYKTISLKEFLLRIPEQKIKNQILIKESLENKTTTPPLPKRF